MAAAPTRLESKSFADDASALLVRLGMFALAILVPCVAVISRRPIFVLTPIAMILIAIGSRLSTERRPRTLARLQRACTSPVGLVTLLLILWCGMSMIWTPFPELARDRFIKTAGTILVSLVTLGSLPNAVKASNANLLPIGVAAAAIAIAAISLVRPEFVAMTDTETGTVQRAMIGVAVLFWPAVGALANRERMAAAGGVAVLVAVAAVVAWSPATLVAIIISIVAFTLACLNPGLTGILFGSLTAALIIAAPVVPIAIVHILPDHGIAGPTQGYFANWAEIVRLDWSKLLTGHGFDTTARALQAGRLGTEPPRGLLFEVWYELGLVGAAAIAALAFMAFAIAGRSARVTAPFLTAMLLEITVLSVADQPLSELWWLTTVNVAAVSFVIAMRAHAHSDRVRATVAATSGVAG